VGVLSSGLITNANAYILTVARACVSVSGVIYAAKYGVVVECRK